MVAARGLVALLRKRGLTLAAAESCTGGLVGAAITAVPGASVVFLGATVAYADTAKRHHLSVPAAVLRHHGAVSRESAVAMARGARRAFGSDLAVAVTGIAGPGGGVPGKPVGTVWFAVAGPGAAVSAVRRRFPGSRADVRRAAVREALDLVAAAARDQLVSEFAAPPVTSY